MRSAYVVCLAVLLQVSLCMPTDNSTTLSEISSETDLDKSDAEPTNSSTEVSTSPSETELTTSESTTSDQETESLPYKPEEEEQGNNATTTTGTTADTPSPPPSSTSAPGRGALLCPELIVLAVPFFIRLSSTRLLGVV